MFDGAEFGRQLAIEVKNIIAPLNARIAELEKKIEIQEKNEIFWIEMLKSDQLKGPKGDKGDAGKDGIGSPGRDGRDGGIGERGKDGTNGNDGINGKDGKDGIGFKDLIYDGERTLIWKRDEDEIVMLLPIPIDRGIWREGKYQKGDTVSWDGSAWFAQKDTNEKPGQSKDWRLSVKRGRDGKDGKDGKGEKGDKGDPGLNGRDMTQLGFDGKKW